MKYYDLGDKVVTSCPKAGSRAIEKAIGARKEIHAHNAAGRRVITFLRHPIERLISAYRYFNFVEGWQKDMSFYGYTAPYERFVDAVLDGERNRHWIQQSELLRHGRNFVPTEVYRFEDINEIWPKVIGIPLQRVNASNLKPVDQWYRRNELDNLYSEDLERWNSAKQSSDTQTG